jgi:hypothetical protein
MTEKEIVTDDDDFVMIERNGEILSGGFHVNSILLKHKQSPMQTINKNFNGGGINVSDLFKDLAVPAGIFFQPNKTGGYREDKNKVIDENEVDDDLYEKLVKLASVEDKIKDKKQRKSRKAGKNNAKKNTKKHHKLKINE